jgi:hypothetical protein
LFVSFCWWFSTFAWQAAITPQAVERLWAVAVQNPVDIALSNGTNVNMLDRRQKCNRPARNSEAACCRFLLCVRRHAEKKEGRSTAFRFCASHNGTVARRTAPRIAAERRAGATAGLSSSGRCDNMASMGAWNGDQRIENEPRTITTLMTFTIY